MTTNPFANFLLIGMPEGKEWIVFLFAFLMYVLPVVILFFIVRYFLRKNKIRKSIY